MNFITLTALCHDKASSVNFLQQPHNIRRFNNNHVMHLSLTDRHDRWSCRIQGCRHDIGVRKDTWLQGSQLPFRQIVLFIYCWSKELTSIKFCEEELDIGKEAVIDLN